MDTGDENVHKAMPVCSHDKEADRMGDRDISGVIEKDRQERVRDYFEGHFSIIRIW
jgi:hypothetical protein